ncbi:MAG: hypothetical protein ACRELA_06440 [Candidatus Rokuibacteriota bacterium]
MTKCSADNAMGPSIDARLDDVAMTNRQLARVARRLEQSERLVDLLFAFATGLKRLVRVAIVRPVQSASPSWPEQCPRQGGRLASPPSGADTATRYSG